LNIGGNGGLITTQRVQTATTAATVLADIYTFKQSIAATRFMRTPSWRCTRTSSTRSTASWRRAVRASLRSSGKVATVRCPARGFLEWSTMQTSLTTTSQRLAILGDWSGFTIVDRLDAQIELILHLFGATNRFPTGAARDLLHLAIFVGCHQPNALRLICSELLLDIDKRQR
jgi:hypothetical protein